MQLVLKLPANKAPFIGVILHGQEQSGLLNADLILKHQNKKYRIIIEHIHHVLNLRLICEEIVSVRFYDHLEFDPEQLKSWLYVIKRANYVNFSQLKLVNEKLSVLRTSPQNKLFVLKIYKVEYLKA
jgi:hypothetical protein